MKAFNKDTILIHFGASKYRKSDFQEIQNSKTITMLNKPQGGFWSCEYTPELDFRSEWELYVKDCEWDEDMLNEYFLFKISNESKVYVIDSEEDLNILEEKYGYNFKNSHIDCTVIDYEKMAKDYDAIYMTDDGLYENMDKVASWCIESLCIFNPDIVKEVGM